MISHEMALYLQCFYMYNWYSQTGRIRQKSGQFAGMYQPSMNNFNWYWLKEYYWEVRIQQVIYIDMIDKYVMYVI